MPARFGSREIQLLGADVALTQRHPIPPLEAGRGRRRRDVEENRQVPQAAKFLAMKEQTVEHQDGVGRALTVSARTGLSAR